MTTTTTARPMVPPVAVAGPGAPDVVPPPAVPLAFLTASGIGLVGLGLAVFFVSERLVTTPTYSTAVAAVHLSMLAFLTTGVLGALHQFGPVVARRRLRSTRAAWFTFVGMVVTAWLLPFGFAFGPEALVAAGAVIGTTTIAVAVWNLSAPLSSPDGGLPLWGLRFSIAYLAATVLFGAVYAFDRQTGWFPLLSHRVLAHAHLGLVGWLGLTYVAVAEKLWPMFLLAHRPHDKEGRTAVALLAAGAPILTVGLLLGVEPVAWVGGLLAAAGLIAHLASLRSAVRHRRRKLELLHAFLFTSSAFLVLGLVLAGLAAGLSFEPGRRSDFVAAEVAALVGWLGLAVLGHVHKIVPFIGYSALRARGITKAPGGGPLMFAHLFLVVPARAALVLGAAGFLLIVVGLLVVAAPLVAAGGLSLSVAGVATTLNLALTPRTVLSEVSP